MKRQKSDNPKTSHPSKVFSPYRTIGLVSNKVPFSITNLGQSFVITTVVGRSFQIYDASNLNLLFVSQPQTESDIQCIEQHFQHTFVATKTQLLVFKRARQQSEENFTQLELGEKPLKILAFGEFVVAATNRKLLVYKFDSKSSQIEHYTTILFSQLLGSVVDIAHLPTYLNKIVVATESSLVLVNIKTGKVVHTFEEVPAGIALIEPSATALDVVAVAAKNGDVSLFNIRDALTLFTLRIGEPVTTMTFRSDAQILGVGNTGGDLFFYDLNSRRRVHSVRSLHVGGPVVRMQFLTSQPICVSAGTDNVLYELAFDPSISQSNTAIAPPPRVLRHRGGHARPPSTIAFTDQESHFLLSGSLDQSLWAFSLRKDAQSHEFSQRQQGALKQKSQMNRTSSKFPPITSLAYEANKERQWDNILTVHKNEPFARTWSGKRGIVGSFEFKTLDGSNAKSVGISRCGNFGFVGSASGSIAGYNMQSGKLRKQIANAHTAAITDVTCNATNSLIISASLDGTINFYDFKTCDVVHTIKTGSPVSQMKYHSASGLIAAALDSMSIIVIDIITRKKIRDLRGHGNRITDFDFSPDGRWIISGALDNTIRTWDIPTGGCIDAVYVPNPVTSLCLSPGGEWMATAHVNGVGISLWTMRSQFHTVAARLVDDKKIRHISMPNISGENGAGLVDAALDSSDDEDYDFEVDNWDRPSKLAPELETLSLEPRHKFNMLVNLDTIKERNKPVEPPKQPQKAPFFLGLPQEQQEQDQLQKQEQLLAPTGATSVNDFGNLIKNARPDEICDYLVKLGPSATDVELRSLQTDELLIFIDSLVDQLKHRRNFELVQAWIKMILNMHSDVFSLSGDHKQALERLRNVQQQEIDRMQGLTRFGSGVLRYLRAL